MNFGLNITVLVDNNTKMDSHLLAEHGLSFYVECDDLKLLFDTGDTDVYLKNAAKIGIDLQSIDLIAFSHHHYDHVGGLKYFPVQKKIKLIGQKYVFYPRIDCSNDLSKRKIIEKFDVVSVDCEPLALSENLIFLAEIPRLNDFESQKDYKIPHSGELTDNFLLDDTAMIYKSYDEIIIITGCSHSGICNIVQYAITVAKKKWKISKIKTIIGGLHIINATYDLLTKTISFLKNKNISEIYPCHCTDLNTKIAFAGAGLKVHEVAAGMMINF